jgi:tetratricopeptide (TPR) repeat protein
MSCRHHFWAVILIFSSCASLLDRTNDFERGIELYKDKQYNEAISLFQTYHAEHPDSDSTLYYLFDCYRQLGRSDEQTLTLEKLVKRGVDDENVYLNLIYYYRKDGRFDDLYELVLNMPATTREHVDKHSPVTRKLFAEFICGALGRKIETDPMIFTISKGYLPRFPDGQLYEDDTLTMGNLIILLDRLVEPVYPRNLHPMKHISTRSYLYLPYMRLVHFGILQFDPYVIPDHYAKTSIAIHALEALIERGHFD